MNPNRRRVVIPIVVLIIVSGALSRSPHLSAIRTVDALLLLAAGAAVGVALTALLHRQPPTSGPVA